MKLLTIGIKAKTWNDIEPFLHCGLQECEIIISCDETLASQLRSNTTIKVNVLQENDRAEDVFCEDSTTDYLLVIKSGEMWNTEQLREVINFIKRNQDVLVLKYIEGFYDTETRKSFVHEVNPATTEKFNLQSLFDGPKYFVPGIKFLWPVQIIKQMSITYNQTVVSEVLGDALYGIEIFAAMYKLGNYGNLKISSQVINFLVLVRFSKPQFTEKYFESLMLKHEIWTTNLWTTVSLRSTQLILKNYLLLQYYRILTLYRERFNQDELLDSK